LITKYFGNEADGDLNNDGKADAAFLLTQESAAAEFSIILRSLWPTTMAIRLNAIVLEDRIAPQSTEINQGVITVNYAEP